MKSVLWTGGWDSTFRVLDLVLNKREEVQPYYIVDTGRESVPFEIKAMDKIKSMVSEKDPSAGTLIRETIMIEIDSIPKNDHITSEYQALRSKSHLGSQYDWLSRYVDSISLDGLELCIHRDDKAEAFIRNDVLLVEEDEDSFYRIKESLSVPELKLFSRYHFPLLELTKRQMEEISKASEFRDIMEETWFCYKPTKEGNPCGFCNPCRYTIEEGLGRRIPKPSVRRRIRFFLAQIKGKVYQKLNIVK